MSVKVILASGSPRRRELMELMGIPFETDVSDADEDIDKEMPPERYVGELSRRKAKAVEARHKKDIIIGADTIVVMDGTVLGKPKDKDDALRMLHMLAGRTHSVYTGVTISYPKVSGDKTPGHSGAASDITASDQKDRAEESFHVRTDVTMYPANEMLLEAYTESSEPYDKAGAYGIQGRGALLVERIEGDYYNVMGLPISGLYRRLINILSLCEGS